MTKQVLDVLKHCAWHREKITKTISRVVCVFVASPKKKGKTATAKLE